MTDNWHSTYDVVVVGTGASALSGAITAEYNGIKTLSIMGKTYSGLVRPLARSAPFHISA